jgi:hypothetical protein
MATTPTPLIQPPQAVRRKPRPPGAACGCAESFNRAPPKSRSWNLSSNVNSPVDRRPRFHPPTGVSAQIGPSLHLAKGAHLHDHDGPAL